MKPIIIIPARYASTRFPGKPLVPIHGKPMVQHVYERCKEVTDLVFIATDDNRIAQAVNEFGGEVVITSAEHPSGTDRCAEAAIILGREFDFDVVINVQGDEPFLEKEQIIQLLECFDNSNTDIATLVTPINSNEILFDENKVKVVRSVSGFALYFSRQSIPFQRDVDKSEWLTNQPYYMHLGMYGYRKDILQSITKLNPSALEIAEKLEQLRWLENGYKIRTAITSHLNFGVDTPLDLENLLKKLL